MMKHGISYSGVQCGSAPSMYTSARMEIAARFFNAFFFWFFSFIFTCLPIRKKQLS
ncbi:MAG: hypothetical protein IKN04_23250 [Clostridia bacterium]|nr:hypothetical protein [Clostridia bacterium]